MSRHCFGPLLASLLLAPLALRAQDAPPPPVPQGVEVLARGPVHEAYASPTAEPVPSKPVAKKPPAQIEEVPPDEKPEGDVVWIGGYWAFDEDRADFLWVSGIWRTVPPGRRWVAGYWREEGAEWQWVSGFWSAVKKEKEKEAEPRQDITYLPAPPVAPEVAAPSKPPSDDSFFVPGSWVWTGERYVFRAGYWARVQPGYVWVQDHYRWTPSGYVFVPGYWDLALKRRGILYAPVIINPAVVTVGFTYTPAYAVRDTVVVESLFVRPAACHYYFGDYYGPRYTTLGYESCVVYSRRRYEPIVVYEVYERRDPTWVTFQINLFNDRCSGRAPRPPRTLVQQNNTVINNTTIVNNNTTVVNNNTTLIAPTKNVAVTKNTKLVKLDEATRRQAGAQAAAVQQVGQQRSNTEVALKPGAPRVARTASLAVPKAEPVKPGMAAPKPPPVTAKATTPPPIKPVEKTAAPKPLTASLAKPTTAPKPAPPASNGIQPAARWLPAPPAAKQPPAANGQPAKPAAAAPKTGQPAKPAPRPQAPPPGRKPPPKDDKDKKIK